MEYHQLVLPQMVSPQGIYGSSRPYWSSRHRSNVRFTPRTGLLAIYGQGMLKIGLLTAVVVQIARGNYNQPKPKIGHLEAHNPLDLVCLDFTKIDPSKNRQGKRSSYYRCVY